MYQWHEECTGTQWWSCKYTKEWNSSLVKFDLVSCSAGRKSKCFRLQEPTRVSISERAMGGQPHILGELTLSSRAVDILPRDYESYNSDLVRYYENATKDDPQIGDVRILWYATTPYEFTVLGQVSSSNEVVPWTSSRGKEILFLLRGDYDKYTILSHLDEIDIVLRHGLRFVYVIVVVLAVGLLLSPIPMSSTRVKGSTGCPLALPTVILVITIAWIWHSPDIYSPLAGLLAVVVCYICYRIYKRWRQGPPPATIIDTSARNTQGHSANNNADEQQPTVQEDDQLRAAETGQGVVADVASP